MKVNIPLAKTNGKWILPFSKDGTPKGIIQFLSWIQNLYFIKNLFSRRLKRNITNVHNVIFVPIVFFCLGFLNYTTTYNILISIWNENVLFIATMNAIELNFRKISCTILRFLDLIRVITWNGSIIKVHCRILYFTFKNKCYNSICLIRKHKKKIKKHRSLVIAVYFQY